MNKKIYIAFILLLTLMNTAKAQESEFNYAGIHVGMAGGDAIDNTYGLLNGDFFGSNASTKTNPISYGGEVFRMVKPNDMDFSFGVSLAAGTFGFDTEYVGETFSSDYTYYGGGLLIGGVESHENGMKSTYFIGSEYLILDTKIKSTAAGAQGVLDIANNGLNSSGGFSIPFGYYSTFSENSSFSGGVGGRYFIGDPDGWYEVYVSLGLSF